MSINFQFLLIIFHWVQLFLSWAWYMKVNKIFEFWFFIGFSYFKTKNRNQ